MVRSKVLRVAVGPPNKEPLKQLVKVPSRRPPSRKSLRHKGPFHSTNLRVDYPCSSLLQRRIPKQNVEPTKDLVPFA